MIQEKEQEEEGMLMDYDMADFALEKALSMGADYAEVRLEELKEDTFVMKNWIAEDSSFSMLSGISVRLLYNKMLGFASISSPDKEGVTRVIGKAISMAKAAESSQITLAPEEPHEARDVVEQKININDTGPDEKIAFMKDLDREIRALSEKSSRFFSLETSTSEKYLLTSEGSKIYSLTPRVNLHHYITVMSDKRSAQKYWQYGGVGGWELMNEGVSSRIVESIREIKEVIEKGVKVKEDKLDVVFSPELTGIIVHESVGHPGEGDRVLGREAAQAGESYLTKDMLGTRIGTDVVNVIDDPTIKGSNGYYLYDDEGVKARERYLMKEGVISEFLHNRESAAMMGVKSNGASRANVFLREPIVRMANTYLKPGDNSFDELVEGVTNGIYFKGFNEWNIDDKRSHQRYVGLQTWRIRNGRIEEPVWAPIIEISTKGLWSSVDAVGKDFEMHPATCGKGDPIQGIPVWMGGASFRIRDVRLG